ncbi:hypothetical protein Tco_0154930 [Tanacetum coccineum]
MAKFLQSLRNANHVRDSDLASLFGKIKYEENWIDSIYEIDKKKSLTTATPLSTAFFSNSIMQDFHDSVEYEKDTRSNFMKDLVCPNLKAFLRSSAKLNLSSSSNLLPSCALVKKNMISEFAEALTPL